MFFQQEVWVRREECQDPAHRAKKTLQTSVPEQKQIYPEEWMFEGYWENHEVTAGHTSRALIPAGNTNPMVLNQLLMPES